MTDPFGIYVHIPFCLRKCPYCDFNSFEQNAAGVSAEDYVEAICLEVESFAEHKEWQGRSAATLFFGGGTPSLLSPRAIERIVAGITRYLPLTTDAEVSLEANPGTVAESVDVGKLRSFRQLGVNRLSIGVQSFSERKLRLLERVHSAADSRRTVESCLKAGFSNWSLDLMFGVKQETIAEWKADLDTALLLSPPHISAYLLTIERGTSFFARQLEGENLCAEEGIAAQMYRLTQDRLESAAREQYEISNYALLGSECRHNLGYWQGVDYLGLGAGAHSFHSDGDVQRRWRNIASPAEYSTRIREQGDARAEEEVLTAEQREIEYLFLQLRMRAGVSLADFSQRFQCSFHERFGHKFTRLVDRGLLAVDKDAIRLTKQGFIIFDSVLRELL